MQGENELKRRLRRLKRLEIDLRFGGVNPGPDGLLWSSFFAKDSRAQCKYPFSELLDHQLRRQAIEDYITCLYYQYYRERGMLEHTADTLALAELGLPPDASLQDIKACFRALVKKHHPDVGGDHTKMVQLLQVYHKVLAEKDNRA